MVSREQGEQLAARLGLAPLPDEGGLFRRTHADRHSSAIYYLLLAPEFSALHTLTSVEVYHWYAGAPLRVLLLSPDGTVSEPLLGPDVALVSDPARRAGRDLAGLGPGGRVHVGRDDGGAAVRLVRVPARRPRHADRGLPGGPGEHRQAHPVATGPGIRGRHLITIGASSMVSPTG